MPGVPAISVVLPYRDAAATLASAVDSVLGGGFEDLEVLAVDDGSRDEGPAWVHARARQDPRIRTFTTGGAGLVAALRCGTDAARAPLVARMDADDVSLPGRLAAQVSWLRDHPDVQVLGTGVRAFPEESVGEGLARYVAWMNGVQTPHEHACALFVEAPLCHPSVLIRREALIAVGGYRDVAWAEDYDLWLRMDACGMKMAKLGTTLLHWRHHPDRATFTHPRYALPRFTDAKAPFLAARLARMGRPVIVWGAGPTGKRLARALEPHGIRARAFVDIDPEKIGRMARGVSIVAPEALVRGDATVVAAVGARGARDLIRARLGAAGWTEGEDFLCAS